MHRMWIIAGILIAIAVGLGVALPLGINNTQNASPEPANLTQVAAQNSSGIGFVALADPSPPSINDPNLRVQLVATGLSQPTSMTFVDSHDLLVLQKDNGKVRLIENGTLLQTPLLDVFVNKANERGLLGVATSGIGNATRQVFLYYTEDISGDTRNRVYRYDWSQAGGLQNQTLVLDLPGTPGPNHDGGKIIWGPDDMLYAVIGDLNRNGMLQNYPEGGAPDNTSIIIRINSSGDAGDPILSGGSNDVNKTLARYYAYGIRNSFGLAFDPVTGILWDTENGPNDYDEINVVEPGFNSGWEKIKGPIGRSNYGINDLVSFAGSEYSDPEFSIRQAQGITDIEFFNSSRLGSEYANNIFVGDIVNGNLYYFTLNEERTGLALNTTQESGLADLVADNELELDAVTFGHGFQGITDIETGPDGYLYILSYSGNLYRLVPAS